MSTSPMAPLRRERADDNDDATPSTTTNIQQQQQSSSSSTAVAAPPPDRSFGCGPTLFEAISRYNNSPPPPSRFSGVLKERYSDFIVREMAPRPLVLTNLQVPTECRDPPPPKAVEYVPPTAERIKELLSEILGEEDTAVLLAALASDPRPAQVTLPTPRTDKLERSKIHQLVKQCGFVDSATAGDGKINIAVGSSSASVGGGRGGAAGFAVRGGRGGGRGGGGRGGQSTTSIFVQGSGRVDRAFWPKGRGEYLHFTLYKENLESGAALRQIAGKMGVPLRALAYCGNKDKRAVTTQRVAARHLSAERLANLNGMSFGRSSLVRVGDFEYRNESLSIGKLNGNGFSIVLRRVPREAVSSGSLVAFEASLRENGMANYFGPQRFGTTSIPSSDVGRALIVGDYRKTLSLVLSSKVEICPDFAEAVEAYKSGDIATALKKTPYHCTFERDALIALNQNPTEYQQAVLVLPRPLTMLYCHSVQSLVWNTMVANRLRVAPAVLEGDLVLVQPDKSNNNNNNGDDDADQNNNDAADVLEAAEEDPSGVSAAGDDNAGGSDGPLPAVRHVTADDIRNKRYSLSDVLLPIPGPDPDLQFPTCEVSSRAAYVKCMEELGLGSDGGLLQVQKFIQRRFHLHGAYRSMVVVPANMTLTLKEYETSDQLLVETDWSRMKRQQQQQQQNNKQQKNEDDVVPVDTSSAAASSSTTAPAQHTQQQAVVVEFELPAGSYATSVLREMCVTVNDSRTIVQGA